MGLQIGANADADLNKPWDVLQRCRQAQQLRQNLVVKAHIRAKRVW
jgi:hypothetical protein